MNPQALRKSCEEHLPETLSFLKQMVAINSFTSNSAGVNQLAKLTAAGFSSLGFESKLVQAANPEFGCHLVMKRPQIPGGPTVALISHLDTVFPEEEEKRNHFSWREEGDKIFGPGTNDIKGGTALIRMTLAALAHVAPELYEKTNWVILLNACEERDSHDFGLLCRRELPADTAACLIFEADGGTNGAFSMVASRKGRATFLVEVEGHGAHAGGGHQRGANAIVQLAHTLTELHEFTDYASGLTVNIGSCTGGTVVNRVPHHASARLEMRSSSPELYQRAKQAILAHHGEGRIRNTDGLACQVRVTLQEETQPWPANPATDKLIQIWQESGQALGHDVSASPRGGLSDGNVIWEYFPTLDGLGPCGDDCHCSEHLADGTKRQESVDRTSFVPKAMIHAVALARLLEGRFE